MLTKLLVYALIAIALAGAGSFAGYHFTDKYWSAKYEAKIGKINQDSSNRMALAVQARAKVEQSQKDAADAAKRKYDETIATLTSTVAKLRAEHVVLHDPGREVHHAAAPTLATSTSSSIVTSSSGDALSRGATDFLLGFAQRADSVRAALLECQADDEGIRTAVNTYNHSLMKIRNESSKQASQSVGKNQQ